MGNRNIESRDEKMGDYWEWLIHAQNVDKKKNSVYYVHVFVMEKRMRNAGACLMTESFSSLSFSLPIVERFTEKAKVMKATYSQLLNILMDSYDGITK